MHVLGLHSGIRGCLVDFSLSRNFVYPFQPLTFLEGFLISVLLDVLLLTAMWTVCLFFNFELDSALNEHSSYQVH